MTSYTSALGAFAREIAPARATTNVRSASPGYGSHDHDEARCACHRGPCHGEVKTYLGAARGSPPSTPRPRRVSSPAGPTAPRKNGLRPAPRTPLGGTWFCETRRVRCDQARAIPSPLQGSTRPPARFPLTISAPAPALPWASSKGGAASAAPLHVPRDAAIDALRLVRDGPRCVGNTACGSHCVGQPSPRLLPARKSAPGTVSR